MCKWLKWSKGSALTVLLLCVLASKDGPLLQITRLLGAAASLGESAGHAAGKVLDSASAVASSATEVVLSVATNTMSLSSNVWNGIDLFNVTAGRCSASLTADSSVILGTWLSSRSCQVLLPCMNNRLRLAVVAAAESISLQLPELDTTAEDIYLRGIYGQQRLQASIMWNGQLRIIFDSLNVTFTPVWANPLWQTLGWPHDSERDQILNSLRETSMALPSHHISWDLTQEELHNGFLWPRLTGRLQCVLRLLALQTSAWTMIFGFDALRGCRFWLCVATLSWKYRSEFKSAIRTLFRIILSRGNQLFPSISPLSVQDWLLIELT